MTKRFIAEWFALKNRIYDKEINLDQIERETEKAIMIKVFGFDSIKHTEDVFTTWIPKSVLLTEEQWEDYKKEAAKKVANFEVKRNAGLERNQMLKDLAKANGIKGIREIMTTATLEKKLTEAGITF